MAKKTIAMLEEELRLEREKSAGLQMEIDTIPVEDIKTGDELDLIAENAELKEAVAKNKAHNAESEARTLAAIADMETNGADTSGCMVFTPDEYREHSKQNGRIMGRKAGVVTKCSIEELRSLINSEWTPSMVMEKHGMSENALQQLVWQLSLKELRGKSIKFSIARDFFGKEA